MRSIDPFYYFIALTHSGPQLTSVSGPPRAEPEEMSEGEVSKHISFWTIFPLGDKAPDQKGSREKGHSIFHLHIHRKEGKTHLGVDRRFDWSWNGCHRADRSTSEDVEHLRWKRGREGYGTKVG